MACNESSCDLAGLLCRILRSFNFIFFYVAVRQPLFSLDIVDKGMHTGTVRDDTDAARLVDDATTDQEVIRIEVECF